VADLLWHHFVVQNGQEGVQVQGTVDTLGGSSLLHEAVVDDDGEAEQRELDLRLAGGTEDLLDGFGRDSVRQVLLGHLAQQFALRDESVVDGDVEGGKCALQVRHHQEDGKRDAPLVSRHERQPYAEGHVRLALVHLPVVDYEGQAALESRSVHGLLRARFPGVGRPA